MSLTLNEAVIEFVLACTGEISDSTIRWYKSHLSGLVAELGDLDVAAVTLRDLRQWRAAEFQKKHTYEVHPWRPVRKGGLSDATKHGRIRATRRFFAWLLEEKYIDNNPALRLGLPKKGRRIPKAISDEDLVKLQAVAVINARDLAIIQVLADSGARVGGLAGLELNDVDLGAMSLTVTEKGRKSREVYLTEASAPALAQWLAEHPGTTDAVFVSQRGDALTTGGIAQMLKRLSKKAGCIGRTNPHSFRHGFARALLNNGASLEAVSELLGHSNVTVTADFYAVWSKQELKEKHSRFSRLKNLHNGDE